MQFILTGADELQPGGDVDPAATAAHLGEKQRHWARSSASRRFGGLLT